MRRDRWQGVRPALGIAVLLTVATGCSLLLKAGDPSFAGRWAGCYRGATPTTGLVLEVELDADGDPTSMLTGCLAIGLGSPGVEMATVAGVAEEADALELSDGEFVYLATYDDLDTEPTLDDTLTITSRGRTIGPIPRCNLADPPTCDDLLGGSF